MIERAVFSYYNAEESFGNKTGFSSYKDFLVSTALSVLLASRHFKEVQFMSTDWGVRVFKAIGLPATEFSNKLNLMKDVSKFFWAYGKIVAYTEQIKPFVHVDNDVFMWEPLPERILNARLCFQSEEPFNLPGYCYYYWLKNASDGFPVRPKKITDNPVWDFAYNCGICGGNDLAFFKEWRKCSAEYIFATENHKSFFETFRDLLIHQNLYHEQYFAACLIKMHKMRDQVEVLHKDAMQISKILKYTHLWGTTKIEGHIKGIHLRLHKEDPKLYGRIKDYCKAKRIQ